LINTTFLDFCAVLKYLGYESISALWPCVLCIFGCALIWFFPQRRRSANDTGKRFQHDHHALTTQQPRSSVTRQQEQVELVVRAAVRFCENAAIFHLQHQLLLINWDSFFLFNLNLHITNLAPLICDPADSCTSGELDKDLHAIKGTTAW
jgi:hypothetical protein